MTIQWYKDAQAQAMHQRFQQELAPIMARLCPNYELSHLGLNRRTKEDLTEEIVIKLHLNQIGSVRVVADEPIPDSNRLRLR